jgi:hypothetical protein
MDDVRRDKGAAPADEAVRPRGDADVTEEDRSIDKPQKRKRKEAGLREPKGRPSSNPEQFEEFVDDGT